MVAVGCDDVVVFAEEGDGADGYCLLPNVEMEEAAHDSLVVIFEGRLFEAPYAKHLAEEVDFLAWFKGGIDFGA